MSKIKTGRACLLLLALLLIPGTDNLAIFCTHNSNEYQDFKCDFDPTILTQNIYNASCKFIGSRNEMKNDSTLSTTRTYLTKLAFEDNSGKVDCSNSTILSLLNVGYVFEDTSVTVEGNTLHNMQVDEGNPDIRSYKLKFEIDNVPRSHFFDEGNPDIRSCKLKFEIDNVPRSYFCGDNEILSIYIKNIDRINSISCIGNRFSSPNESTITQGPSTRQSFIISKNMINEYSTLPRVTEDTSSVEFGAILHEVTKSARELARFLNKHFNKSVVLRRADEIFNNLGRNAKQSAATTVDGVELTVYVGNVSESITCEFSQSVMETQHIESNQHQAVVVTSQFSLPPPVEDTELVAIPDPSSEIIETVSSLDNIPLLSVSAFDAETRTPVQAKVAYSINIENSTSISTRLQSMRQGQSFFNTTIIRSIHYSCEFYDVSSNSFSTKGCELRAENATTVSCYCNHTTTFAVLLTVESFVIPETVKILSFVTESISVVFLIITICALIKVKGKLKSDRTFIQINLAIAVLLLHFFNIFHDVAILNSRMCELIAVTIHFSFLATASWMCIEGVTLVVKTTKYALKFIGRNKKAWTITRLGFGWGLPSFIVMISSIIGFATQTYMSELGPYGYAQCWLSPTSGALIGAVIVPVGIIFAVNLVIVGRIMYVIYNISSKSERFKPLEQRRDSGNEGAINPKHLKVACKNILILFPVLGVTFLFSFLSGVGTYEASLVFMYLNVIFNGLQGLFLFIVYCVHGSEVKEALLRLISRRRLASIDPAPCVESPKRVGEMKSTLKSATSKTNVESFP